MRERYVRHFLHNVIELADTLGIYYVQDCFCDRSTFFGVELKTFFDHRQTVEWLRDCIAYDRCGIYNLRSFLVQNAPRRNMVHRMDNHRVMDEVARVIIDYHYPVVIRPWCEPPWRSSNTIDVICAIQNGAPLSVMSRSPELDQAAKMLKSEVQKHSQGATQSYQENLLARYDIDSNDVDTASSSWNIERWKQEHQHRLAARRQTLQPHSPQGWNDPDAPKKVIANVVKILAGAPKQILQHPIDSLIIEPVKDFVGMFKTPKADPDRDQARHNVQGRYYQSKNIDPNDLDTADHPGRTMQWVDIYNKRHRNDRHPAKVPIPSPEETENILAMLISFMVAKRFAKAVRRGSGAMAEESAVTAKRTVKAKSDTKGIPEVENPKAIEKLENKAKGEYSGAEKGGRPKTASSAADLSKKEFKNPKEAYDHINKLDDDVKIISKRKIGSISKEEASMLKKSIREELPADDYPSIDFDKIDKVIDKNVGKNLSQSEIKELKNYVFKNKDFEPPLIDKAADKDLFNAFNKNKENWAKLIDGNVDQKADTFLKHEYLEMEIKKVSGYEMTTGMDRVFMHEDIHGAVLEVFNTQL